jgi:diaminopimelate epimerase
MTIAFYKYHGTGNDFVMIDNMGGEVVLTDEMVVSICDRHFGIGSDGLILIEKSEDPNVDFSMNFYNPDASKSFCGNGSRCAVSFAKSLGYINDTAVFSAIDGIHQALIDGDFVSIRMRDVSGADRLSEETYFLNTGSPHFIEFSPYVGSLDIIAAARPVRYSDTFKPGGTNVNYVEWMGEKSVFVRTYERGVEDETLSCGTGVTAAALACALVKPQLSTVEVNTKGGKLEVSFIKNENSFSNIFLKGPAKFVFKGEIDLI